VTESGCQPSTPPCQYSPTILCANERACYFCFFAVEEVNDLQQPTVTISWCYLWYETESFEIAENSANFNARFVPSFQTLPATGLQLPATVSSIWDNSIKPTYTYDENKVQVLGSYRYWLFIEINNCGKRVRKWLYFSIMNEPLRNDMNAWFQKCMLSK